MPKLLYDTFYQAVFWVEEADFRDHCQYLKDRGFTGVHLGACDPFDPNYTLKQSGKNGTPQLSNTSGTQFVINPTFGNHIRRLIDIAAEEGLKVALITYGASYASSIDWIGQSSDNGVLRVQNSFMAGQQLYQYYGTASNITHLIHGWDTATERSWENQIWANVRAGWEQAVGPAAVTVSVGPGIEAQTLNGLAAGEYGPGADVAFPWTAPRNGSIKALAMYWVHSAGPNNQASYSKGTGGILRVTLRDARDGNVLGEYTMTNPMSVGGEWYTQMQADVHGDLSFRSFNFPAAVEAGRLYWVQVSNTHADPGNNWVALDPWSDATGAGDWPNMWLKKYGVWAPYSNDEHYNGPQPPEGPPYYGDYDGTFFTATYCMQYTDNTLSSQAPYSDPNVSGSRNHYLADDGYFIYLENYPSGASQQAILPQGTLTSVDYFVESGSGQLSLTVNGQTYYATTAHGWLTFTTNVAVDGMTTLTFKVVSGTSTVKGLYKQWETYGHGPSADWFGGALLGGNKFPSYYGVGEANTDLPFRASVLTGSGGVGTSNVLHGYGSNPNGHAVYSGSSWLDFCAIEPGHLNSNDGSNNAQQAGYWTSVYSTTNGKPIFVTEAHYAHLNENSQVGYFGPAPTAAGMRADVDAMLAYEQSDRLIGVVYGDWYRNTMCSPSHGLKFDNALADGYYNGVRTTHFPSGSPGASYAGVANLIGNDGETEYLEALGIGVVPPGPITVLPGASIQTAINNAPNFGQVNLTADTIYDNVQLTVPAGKTVTLQGTGQWNSAADTGSLLMGGSLVTGWVADGGNWRASWTGTAISRMRHGNANNSYNIWDRARDRLTCTLDEDWLHHASSIAEMNAGVPALMTGHSGQFWFDYGSQTLWVDTDPTGKRVALSTVNRVVTGSGTLLVQDLSVGLSRSDAQEGMIRPEGPDWLLDNVEIFGSHGVGVQGKSDRLHVLGCHIHHNGQLGLGDSSAVNNPSGSNNTTGGICEETLIEYNNMSWYVPGWEAGATKVAWIDNYQFIHNEVRFNFGFGLWDDINCVNPVYRFNYVHENWASGIHHEIGMSATIEFNRSELNGTWPTRNVKHFPNTPPCSSPDGVFPNQNCGGAGWNSHPGIQISESNGLKTRPGGAGYGIFVRHNLVYDNRGGIVLRQINRDGDGSAPGGDAYWNKGIAVTNNDVWWDDNIANWPGATDAPKHGAGDSHPTFDVFAAGALNYFDGNDYSINGTETIPTRTKFEWSGAKTYAQWRAAGQDTLITGRTANPEDFGLTVSSPPPSTGPDGYFLFTGNNAQYISTPDSPNLSPRNSIRVEVLAALDDWTPVAAWECLVGKYDYVNNLAAWRFILTNGSSQARFESTTTGNVATGVYGEAVLPVWADGSQNWLAADYNASLGSYEFEYSTDGELWVSFATGTFTPHQMFDSTTRVEIGRVGGVADNAVNGKVYAVRIYNNGGLVADPDFRNNTQATGGNWANGGVDSFGNVWSVTGSVQYVPPTSGDQEVLMSQFGLPAAFILSGEHPLRQDLQVTFTAVGAFSLTGGTPGYEVGGTAQYVNFTAPFQFSLAGSLPTNLSIAQSVSPLSVPAAFTLTGGTPLTSIPLGPDPTDRSLGLQYGYFARRPKTTVSGGLLLPDSVYADDSWQVDRAELAASTPLDITSDLEASIRVRRRRGDVGMSLFTRGRTVGETSWVFAWASGVPNELIFITSATGGALNTKLSTVGLEHAIDRDVWLKAVYTAAAGSVSFFYSFTDTNDETLVAWEQLGTTLTGLDASLYVTADPLEIGASATTVPAAVGWTSPHTVASPWSYVYRSIVKSVPGVYASRVLDADFTVQQPGVTSFVESSSSAGLVTLKGNALLGYPPTEDLLILVPIGRSQQIGVKAVEGWEPVSGVITWISGQEDQLMASLESAWLATRGNSTAAITVAVSDLLREMRYRRPDGTEL